MIGTASGGPRYTNFAAVLFGDRASQPVVGTGGIPSEQGFEVAEAFVQMSGSFTHLCARVLQQAV